AISALWLSSVLAKAPTPIEVETFLALDQWPVVAGLATFLVQALLIIWLLVTRARRREAEVESRRLALLADSERVRLNEVVSHVPGIVWEAQIDPVTNEVRTTFISDYAEQIVGYTVAECVSSPSFALGLVHEADRERVAREAAAVFSGTPTLLQFRMRAKDGSIVWAEAHVAPQLNETETIVGIRGVTLDVTERHEAEAARMQSEETFARSFR